MLDLQVLTERIADGDDLDLYRGIRSLDPRFPVHQDVSDAFMRTAGTVVMLFPDRARTELRNPYDARIIVMEFCDHPQTSRDDVVLVLINT